MRMLILPNLEDSFGRWYHPEDLRQAVMVYNEVLGELGVGSSDTIALDRVAVSFKNFRVEEDGWVGDMKILQTPMGNIVQDFVDDGLKIRPSLRGIGYPTQKPGEKFYAHLKRIIAIDIWDVYSV